MGTESGRRARITRQPAEPADPYFYGWRMVPGWDERGQTWEQVPLTEWDVLHPEEEDFIVTSDAHDRDIHYLRDVFEDRLAGRDGVLVLCDHRVLWGPPALGAHGPDVSVFENLNGPWDTLRATFPVAEMGARPVVIVEVTSPSTRDNDLDNKVVDYFRAGVPLYVIADRREFKGRGFIRFLAYRASPEGYLRLPEDRNGVWVEPVGVWIRADGDALYCTDEQGNRIPDMSTQRDEEKARADAEKARAEAEKARAEAEMTRAEAEKERAEAEKARAEAEMTARLSAEQKMKELEAELKRLREAS